MANNLRQKLFETAKAVSPLVVVVFILHFTVAHMPINILLQFIIGVIFVIIGMVLFLTGVEIGILPMGRAIGSNLPRHGSLALIIILSFLIGFVATIAEPDVVVLTQQVDAVSNGTVSKNILIYVIGIGIGFFIVVAMIRIILGVKMIYILAGGYGIVIILSLLTPANFVPVAFDAGGVTTGPMSVPIILSLGLGFSSVLANKSSVSDGFGLIGLASIGPIIAVMLMGMFSQWI